MASREGGMPADEIQVDLEILKTSLQVKLFGNLLCLISLQFYYIVLELHSVGFCQLKVYFKVCFEVRKIR